MVLLCGWVPLGDLQTDEAYVIAGRTTELYSALALDSVAPLVKVVNLERANF